MNLYNKYILPKLLNSRMNKEDIEQQRPSVVGQASGLVLETGFGSGLNLPYYKNIEKLYAVDPSTELYKLSEEKIKNASFPVEYFQASAEKLPLADNSVDSVVSTWSLCSIPCPEIALQEIFRVLKSNGKFIFIEHGKSPKSFLGQMQKILTPISKRLAGGCHLDREIDKLIEKSGFDFIKLEKFPHQSKSLIFTYKGIAVVKK